MKNKIVLILLSLLVMSCSSVAKNSSYQHAISIAKQQNINEEEIKSVKSCKYFGFIGTTDEKKAMKSENIDTKIYSEEYKDTIRDCVYVYGLKNNQNNANQ